VVGAFALSSIMLRACLHGSKTLCTPLFQLQAWKDLHFHGAILLGAVQQRANSGDKAVHVQTEAYSLY